MTARAPDPRALDVANFAAQSAELAGDWPLADLARLADCAAEESAPGPAERVRWQLRGEQRKRLGGEPLRRLHLQAEAHLALSCQRCLAPVRVPLAVRASLRFVADEQQAAELDALSEEDVLALPRRFDLREWLEDELLLALPLVPRHARCPAPLPGAEAVGVGPAAPLGEDVLGDEAADPEAEAPPGEHQDGADGEDDRPHPFAALAALRTRPAEDAAQASPEAGDVAGPADGAAGAVPPAPAAARRPRR